MFKYKNQVFLIVSTIVFVVFIFFVQNIISQKIYKYNDFENISYVINQKEFTINEIFYEGKYLANAINSSLDLNYLIDNSKKTLHNFDLIKPFFNSQHSISNITLFNKNLEVITNNYKTNFDNDLNLDDLKRFINSKNDSILSRMYLKKKNNEFLIPYLPKISFLKKIFNENNQISGVLAIEYDLNFRFRTFFENDKYDYIILDEYGEVYFHYDENKSWTFYFDDKITFKDQFKDISNKILTNVVFSNDYLYSKRLDVKIDRGLILISKLSEEYLLKMEELYFKRKLIFFLIFGVCTIGMLTLAIIIIQSSVKSLEKYKKLSKDYKALQVFSTQAEQIAHIGFWEVDDINNVQWNSWMFTLLDIKDDNSRISYEMFMSYIHPNDRERYDKEYRYSKSSSTEHYISFRVITNSGEIKYVEQRWKHHYNNNGRFLKTVGSLYDITSNKLIQDSFENENRNLKTYLDTLSTCLVIIDSDMKIQFYNKAFLKALAISTKELLKIKSFTNLLSEDKEMFKYILIDLLEKKKITRKELRLYKNNGEVSTFKSDFTLIPKSDEILISLEDVTNEIKNQDKVLITQSRMADLGEMLIDLTYQWRQPLTLISTSASFLKLEHELGTEQRQESIDVLSKIIESSTNLSNTLDDFKYYVEDNNNETTFSVNNSIEKVIMILANGIFENEIQIHRDFDEDVELKNIENSFMQVLVNILKNSIEALKDYSRQEKLILISTSIQKDTLEITITDNAWGIEPEIISSVFDEFFTTKSEQGSTGLGLFLAKKIVNTKLKGTITVENKEFEYKNRNYKGASFTVSLSLLNKEI